MSLVIVLPLLVAIIGLLTYALASGKASTAGLYAFAVGLLAFLLRMSNATIRF